jgi:hypothetical protein
MTAASAKARLITRRDKPPATKRKAADRIELWKPFTVVKLALAGVEKSRGRTPELSAAI